MPNETHIMRGIRSVAGPQWGCVTTAQLLALGLSRRRVEYMAKRGFLIRLHRGVYVVGTLSPAPEQRFAAAVLAGGKGAALMHTGAAGNFGLMVPRAVMTSLIGMSFQA